MSNKIYQIVREDMSYKVIEQSTGNAVFYVPDKSRALSVAKRLNGGCGFRGWTPTFMLQAIAA